MSRPTLSDRLEVASAASDFIARIKDICLVEDFAPDSVDAELNENLELAQASLLLWLLRKGMEAGLIELEAEPMLKVVKSDE